MKPTLIIGLLALLIEAGAPLLYVTGSLGLDACKVAMLVATIVWFGAAGVMNFAGAGKQA